MTRLLLSLVSLPLMSLSQISAAEYRAGFATIDLTPTEPVYLSGYAARTHPLEGVLLPIHAKALAIEDHKGARAVFVGTDLIGLPRAVSDLVAAGVQKQFGLDRSALVLNSSHTHTGPMLHGNLSVLFDLGEKDQAAAQRYTEKVTRDLIAVVGAALKDLKPANVFSGSGEVHFAINRRQASATGVTIGLNPQGPTDPTVPVLKVTSPDGKLLGVLFGYACHNTTLTAQFYQISGDYAGFAQAAFEKEHPGATAIFFQLCGGDQNPNPRSSLAAVQDHGAVLAAEVKRVVASNLQPLRGPVRSAFQVTDLAFAHHTREQFEKRATETNVYRVRNAKMMLRTYDDGHPIRSYSYPVQAVSIGKDFTLLALGGEVVVDYDLRAKREFGAKGLVVAGYCNDVMSYVSSKRVLKEGGYEADESMVYYGLPAPWAEDTEDRIFTTIHKVMARVGKK
jgi:neutral ceramidase